MNSRWWGIFSEFSAKAHVAVMPLRPHLRLGSTPVSGGVERRTPFEFDALPWSIVIAVLPTGLGGVKRGEMGE